MFRRSLTTTLVATALIATALFAAGCKKEEQAKESTPPASEPSKEAAAPAGQGGAASFDFEKDIAGWGATDKGVKIGRSGDKKHGGISSLKVSGVSGANQYNYAVSPKFALEPGKKYKISAWMLVDSVQDGKLPPVVKVATYQDDKWSANAFTRNYALNKKGEWQELTTTFDAPQGGKVSAMISVEKGAQKANSATLFVDDVTVVPAQ